MQKKLKDDDVNKIHERREMRNRYLITGAIALALSIVLAFFFGVFGKQTADEVFEALSNSFFVSGIILAGAGGMIFASNEGSFDMIAFGVKTVFNTLDPRKMRGREKFHEYRQRKQERKVKFVHMIIVGGICILLSVAFLGLRYIM